MNRRDFMKTAALILGAAASASPELLNGRKLVFPVRAQPAAIGSSLIQDHWVITVKWDTREFTGGWHDGHFPVAMAYCNERAELSHTICERNRDPDLPPRYETFGQIVKLENIIGVPARLRRKLQLLGQGWLDMGAEELFRTDDTKTTSQTWLKYASLKS